MRMFTSCILTFVFFWTGLSQNVIHPCNKHMFDSNVHICQSTFNKSMETSGYHQGCAWPAVKRIYYDLKLCVDHWASVSLCRSRGSLVDDFFQEIHQKYFVSCGRVQDPPVWTLVFLIAPLFTVTLLMPLLCAKLVTRNIDTPNNLNH
ncbi:receptor activity-modifying protein 1-like [Syngnathoides biaculeatus]|uniref:receptor activity-modifying protein 1-like n=1 Tax=Syngnathoides biaculeatus TaxID=300417 RepID=UPI002ADE5403|nr:receptor activity-modifying protein 1-like [Syngnathoides biaculeatus]